MTIVEKHKLLGGRIHKFLYKVDNLTGEYHHVKQHRDVLGRRVYERVGRGVLPPGFSYGGSIALDQSRASARDIVPVRASSQDIVNAMSNAFGNMTMGGRVQRGRGVRYI